MRVSWVRKRLHHPLNNNHHARLGTSKRRIARRRSFLIGASRYSPLPNYQSLREATASNHYHNLRQFSPRLPCQLMRNGSYDVTTFPYEYDLKSSLLHSAFVLGVCPSTAPQRFQIPTEIARCLNQSLRMTYNIQDQTSSSLYLITSMRQYAHPQVNAQSLERWISRAAIRPCNVRKQSRIIHTESQSPSG